MARAALPRAARRERLPFLSPPIFKWLSERATGRPAAETVALLRELGASCVEVDLSRLTRERRTEVQELAEKGAAAGLVGVLVRDGRMLLRLDPLRPVLVDAGSVEGLAFRSGRAFVPGPAGRVAFRLGASSREVRVGGGGEGRQAMMTLPIAGVGGLWVTVEPAPRAGEAVVDARSGRTVGRGQ